MTEIDTDLSQRYREASTEVPPATIDAAILAAARRQAQSHAARPDPWWRRWMMPASVMTTMVLAVSIALLMEREPTTSEDKTVDRVARPTAAFPAPAAESAKAKAAPASRSEAGLKDSFPPPATLPRELPSSQDQPTRPFAAPPAPAESFPAPAPTTDSDDIMAPAAIPELRERAVGRSAGAASMGAPAAAKAESVRQNSAQRSPEDWLEEIRRLKQAGREQEAAAEVAAFRKAYPDVPVPAM